jgi:uncharacterized protein (DUF362 family)
MSTVAVIRTSPDTVLDDYARLMQLAGVATALKPGAATILKENISWHQPFLSANTTPWQLEGTIRGLQAAGFNDLVCAANRTVVTNPFKGEKLNRLGPVLQKYHIPVKYNFRAADMQWVRYEPHGKMLALSGIFPEGIWLPDFFRGKNIVHLPTVKCHIYTTTTGAMKNAFGGLLNTKRHYTHSVIHKTLVDLLRIQQEIHAGLFAVMDGTVAGNGPGPRTMRPVDRHLILAGADQVAIDAVAAKMMGFDPLQLDYIRLAHEAGLGMGDVRRITVTGNVDIAKENWHFSVGDNTASLAGDLFWFSPFKILQRLLFHTPLVYAFIMASYVYHDFLWWPTIGRARMRALAATSPWSRLFERYPS